MQQAAELLQLIFPLYILIFLGFLAGKFAKIDRKSLATIVFYFVVPVVFFNYALQIDLQPNVLFLPLLAFAISILVSQIFWRLGKVIWPKDKYANIVAFSSGTGNTGYFGLPVAMLIFDHQHIALYMILVIGVSIFDYTFGAYYFARSQLSKKQAIKQVLSLPMIYALIAGLILNKLGFELPDKFNLITEAMRGAYITLGMMIIGISIAAAEKIKFKISFTAVLFAAKFVVMPAIVIALMQLDINVTQIFAKDIWDVIILLAFVPPAVNTVIFAQLYNCHPEETAAAILLGSLFAIFYTPIALSFFLIL